MRYFNIFAFCVIFHVWGITEAVDFRDCGTGIGIVQALDIIPCNSEPCIIRIWQRTTFGITFTTATNINAGEVSVEGGYNSKTKVISLPQSSVCRNLTPPCPVRGGVSYTYRYTAIVRGYITPGLLNIRWNLLDTNRRSFVCVQFQAKFV
ncbi:hypothetical protein CRM22_002521 [Opisthorchis felineus]|uniref:MD-2-related lipid-recognition domain-containing protein n=1 Tax=Opisthorchis felineus TaxID=147828 RepID=A0A4V3SGB1_OPIFE|nr:hypothetical protein CRM22_002521 [Opisthorchis felineus]